MAHSRNQSTSSLSRAGLEQAIAPAHRSPRGASPALSPAPPKPFLHPTGPSKSAWSPPAGQGLRQRESLSPRRRKEMVLDLLWDRMTTVPECIVDSRTPQPTPLARLPAADSP